MNNSNPIWDVYDLYRTARLNVKYYSHKLTNLKRINTIMEIAIAAGAPSSAVAGIFFWNTPCGQIAWKWLLGLTAILAFIKPFIKIPDHIEAYEKSKSSHQVLENHIHRIIIQISQDQAYTEKHRALLEVGVDMNCRIKENEPEHNPNRKLIRKYQKEVEEEIPVDQIYIPEVKE